MEGFSPTHPLGFFTSIKAVTLVPIPAVTAAAQIVGISFCHSPVTLVHTLHPCPYRRLNYSKDFLAG